VECELEILGFQPLSTQQHLVEGLLDLILVRPDCPLDLIEQLTVGMDVDYLGAFDVQHFLVHHVPLYKDLVVHSMKLVVPSLCYVLDIDDRK